MPHFLIGATNYNIRNPDLQLPRIRHEFPRSSLRYQLISTLNETSPEIMEMVKNCTKYIFINHVRKVLWMGTGTRVQIQIIVTQLILLFVCRFKRYPTIIYYNNNNNCSVLYLIHSYICRLCIILCFIAGM